MNLVIPGPRPATTPNLTPTLEHVKTPKGSILGQRVWPLGPIF